MRSARGVFSPDDPQRFAPLIDGLTSTDWFMVAGDFESYAEAQAQVAARWRDRRRMVALQRAEHGACRLVLVRPVDPRICPEPLARAGVTGKMRHDISVPA